MYHVKLLATHIKYYTDPVGYLTQAYLITITFGACPIHMIQDIMYEYSYMYVARHTDPSVHSIPINSGCIR